jgi:hypothetical protein
MGRESGQLIRRAIAALLHASALAPSASATVYEVGPGQPLAAIGQEPWASLAPGDVVRFHWRPEP